MTCGKIFYPSRKKAKKDMKRINTVMERGTPRLTGKLYNKSTDEYCCLGVACKVCGVEPQRADYGEYISWEISNVPSILRGSNDTTKLLARMNDGEDHPKRNFSEIADYIEQNL